MRDPVLFRTTFFLTLSLLLHCFQAPPPRPSFLISKAVSAVAWRTSTSTCWWLTTWAAVSAGCYRSSPAKRAAPGEERRPSAPRTATRAGRRRRTRRAGFFRWRRRQALRRDTRPKPKLLNQSTQKSPLLHGASRRVKTNGLRSSRRTRKDFVRKVPSTRSWTLSVTATKARTLHRRTCGGLGSVDTQS